MELERSELLSLSSLLDVFVFIFLIEDFVRFSRSVSQPLSHPVVRSEGAWAQVLIGIIRDLESSFRSRGFPLDFGPWTLGFPFPCPYRDRYGVGDKIFLASWRLK